MLCGKPVCPAIVKLYSFIKTKKAADSNQMYGSSPPGIFVGRIGYPYVYAGPLVPPVLGDTSILDAPEQWLGKTFDEIIRFRTSLVRGKFRVNVKKPFQNRRLQEKTLEVALSKAPVYTEVAFKKKPSDKFFFDGTVQPMGPSAMLRKMNVGNFKTDSRIEKAYADGDLKAESAVLDLYLNGIPVSGIQRAFSVGAFGLKNERRMVPTRWSITAVDSTISRSLIENEVKGKPTINEYSFTIAGHTGFPHNIRLPRQVRHMLSSHAWILTLCDGTFRSPAIFSSFTMCPTQGTRRLTFLTNLFRREAFNPSLSLSAETSTLIGKISASVLLNQSEPLSLLILLEEHSETLTTGVC